MEQAIIVQGFLASEEMHGLRFKFMIGDGDSSVFARIQRKVPYGRQVVNHIVRGYTDKLYKLKANTALPLSARKELTPLISRLTKAARGAITSAGERAGNVDQLRKDLRNGPHHVFGDHAKCVEETVGANGERVGYCSRKNALEKNKVPFMTQTPVWAGILKALEPIVAKADRLMLNVTTNQAERFMGLVACASGGKRVDHTKRGGYQLRCTMAGLRHIKGPGYYISPAKKLLGHSPGIVSKKLFADRARNSAARSKRDSARRSLGFVPRKKATSARAGPDADYGPSAAEPDISAENMEAGKNSVLDALAAVACSDEKRANLERATVGQAENPLWMDARQNRLTASKFGAICNRKPTTSCHSAVISITNPKPIYNDDIVYGNNNEPKAIEMYEERFGVSVQASGLFVDPDYPFLGASPDGLVGEDRLIEVKTIPSINQLEVRNCSHCLYF